jgi:hypothetical protein
MTTLSQWVWHANELLLSFDGAQANFMMYENLYVVN